VPHLVTSLAELRQAVSSLRKLGNGRIALVPTMGALHAGHMCLVDQARAHGDHVVASIFVNPTQFAPHEDFDAYPRTLDSDLRQLGDLAQIVFAPTVREMYRQDHATTISVGGPSAGLETDFRPHFFSGVATVVAKLLIAVGPDTAMFGEKDYQQLLVVRQMVADLALPVGIIGVATLREADGLALSSRNAYLNKAERERGGQLNLLLKQAAVMARRDDLRTVEAWAVQALGEAGFSHVDYVAIRDAQTLKEIGSLQRPARLLAAATVGKTRLIDNMAV
jgi:pantoate--beta-alanine ligase